MPDHHMRWGRFRCRRGSSYVLILATAATVTVIGIAGVTVNRLRTRALNRSNDWAQARLLARSAAEHAIARIGAEADWRSRFNDTTVRQTFGRGAFEWRVGDELDGDLTDDPDDPAVISATGTVGEASYSLKVAVSTSPGPMEALKYCLVADGEVSLGDTTEVDCHGGILAGNNQVRNNGVIIADVEAGSIDGDGSVVGNVTAPAPPKPMPGSGVFNSYKDRATAIPSMGTMEKVVLSPANNPWGQTNPEGIYYIDTMGARLVIRGSRIHGTLVVDCGTNGKVVVEDQALLHAYRPDRPVLIVNGDLELSLDSSVTRLDESSWQTNFNPPGSPYNGQADYDTTDLLPNEVRGLVHVRGDLVMKEHTCVRGAIICEGDVAFRNIADIWHDPGLAVTPPRGYTSGAGKLRVGSWSRITN